MAAKPPLKSRMSESAIVVVRIALTPFRKIPRIPDATRLARAPRCTSSLCVQSCSIVDDVAENVGELINGHRRQYALDSIAPVTAHLTPTLIFNVRVLAS
jgi:hypothetical protein